jgi:hypothetical protein
VGGPCYNESYDAASSKTFIIITSIYGAAHPIAWSQLACALPHLGEGGRAAGAERIGLSGIQTTRWGKPSERWETVGFSPQPIRRRAALVQQSLGPIASAPASALGARCQQGMDCSHQAPRGRATRTRQPLRPAPRTGRARAYDPGRRPGRGSVLKSIRPSVCLSAYKRLPPVRLGLQPQPASGPLNAVPPANIGLSMCCARLPRTH